MIKLLRQLMKLPLMAFTYSVEIFVKMMQGMQRTADQGLDAMISGVAQTLGEMPGGESDLKTNTTCFVTEGAIGDSTEGAIGDSAETTYKEERNMGDRDDKDLCGEDLKLVRYKILFIKRDYEHVFKEDEELIADSLSDTDYTAWKIAQFIQNLSKIEVPSKWKDKNYPRKFTDEEKKKRDIWINELREEDKKYLRVYYQVLDRYPREPFRHDEEQIQVLKDIRDTLDKKVKVEERIATAQEQRVAEPPRRPGRGPEGGL